MESADYKARLKQLHSETPAQLSPAKWSNIDVVQILTLYKQPIEDNVNPTTNDRNNAATWLFSRVCARLRHDHPQLARKALRGNLSRSMDVEGNSVENLMEFLRGHEIHFRRRFLTLRNLRVEENRKTGERSRNGWPDAIVEGFSLDEVRNMQQDTGVLAMLRGTHIDGEPLESFDEEGRRRPLYSPHPVDDADLDQVAKEVDNVYRAREAGKV